MRHPGLPRLSLPSLGLDQQLLALTFQVLVRKRVAVMLRDHLPDDFLPPPPIQTPLSESDQGNLVGNFLA